MVGSSCSPRNSQESSPTPVPKTSILLCSAFFIVQLSHPYMPAGKTIALTRQTFVDTVMSVLFNMLSRLVTEKAMAPHSSTLAWKLPWMEEPGGLQFMGSQRDRTERPHFLSLCEHVFISLGSMLGSPLLL